MAIRKKKVTQPSYDIPPMTQGEYQANTPKGFNESLLTFMRILMIISILILVMFGISIYFLGTKQAAEMVQAIFKFFESFWQPIITAVIILMLIKLVMGMLSAFGINMVRGTADAITRHDAVDAAGDAHQMKTLMPLIMLMMKQSQSNNNDAIMVELIRTLGRDKTEHHRSVREAENRATRTALESVKRADKIYKKKADTPEGYDLDALFEDYEEATQNE